MRKFIQQLRDPHLVYLKVLGKIDHKLLWKKLSGMNTDPFRGKVSLILSFDCDTEKDIEVVSAVHARLEKMGIKPVYAVPGQLLIKGENEYGKLRDKGCDFINHGFLSHSLYNPETLEYKNKFIYSDLTPEEIKEDILKGHETLKIFLGKSPKGFRTPHFGTFQDPFEMNFLYSFLKELEYEYSSSAMPRMSFQKGPFYKDVSGIIEFPVTGTFDRPFEVLDSYSFGHSRKNKWKKEDFKTQFNKILTYYSTQNSGCLINLYADPSQVHEWDDFFNCLNAVPYKLNSFDRLISHD